MGDPFPRLLLQEIDVRQTSLSQYGRLRNQETLDAIPGIERDVREHPRTKKRIGVQDPGLNRQSPGLSVECWVDPLYTSRQLDRRYRGHLTRNHPPDSNLRHQFLRHGQRKVEVVHVYQHDRS